MPALSHVPFSPCEVTLGLKGECDLFMAVCQVASSVGTLVGEGLGERTLGLSSVECGCEIGGSAIGFGQLRTI